MSEIRHKQQAVGYLPMQEDRLRGAGSSKEVFVAMAPAVRHRADHDHGEREIWILPGFTFTP